MDIKTIIEDITLKPTQKRNIIVDCIQEGSFTIKEIEICSKVLDDKYMAIILEAMESACSKEPKIASLKWLEFAKIYLTSEHNSLKRESSRIIGNIASYYPNHLNLVIPKLLENAKNKSTVIKWGSAYALGRIISIPKYAKSELYEILLRVYKKEMENGVKTQYLIGLRNAKMIRKTNKA